MGVSKNRGVSPKMDVFSWKTLFFSGWFGGKIPLFLETPTCQTKRVPVCSYRNWTHLWLVCPALCAFRSISEAWLVSSFAWKAVKKPSNGGQHGHVTSHTKWGFPKMVGFPNKPMGFPTKNDHFGVFWGYHHLRKHPNREYIVLYFYENIL